MSKQKGQTGSGGAIGAVLLVILAIVAIAALAAGAVAFLVLGLLWVVGSAASDSLRAHNAEAPLAYSAAVKTRGGALLQLARAPEHRKGVLIGLFAAGAAVLIAVGSFTGGEGRKSDSATQSTVAGRPVENTQTAPSAPSSKAARPHAHTATPEGIRAGVQIGHQTKFAGCRVNGVLPDRACTPGEVFARATAAQICVSGYSRSVRDVPESLKQQVYAEYGIESHVPGSYEVDHLISLELGGDNSAANLWPEISPGYHQKDGIENRLHDAVCAGSISLRTAQVQIARDWRHTAVGARIASQTHARSVPAQAPARTSAGPSAGTGSAAADFCTTHSCIASFSEGHGTIVQCADGEWSHSGGLPGVCSRHGGAR